MIVHCISAALSPKLIREGKMDRSTSTYPILLTLCVISAIAGLSATTSAADERIGIAAVVRNTVSQLEPQVTRIAKGDEVVRNEVVRTGTDSDARLVFRDDTNLALGPGSTLKLDRTVFDDPKAGDIAIKLTTGAFRFVTGNSNKEAYEIKTPIATMGVRGTTLDILVKKRRNIIVLRTGKVTVCVIGNRNCVDLNHEGDTANVTSNGKTASIDVQNRSSWSFDSACNGALCGKSVY
jgi:ferric-dicitrate binding protein FerR (iron transport regulator)